MTDPQVVYVITDLDPKPEPKTRVWASIREALRPTALISMFAVPLLALASIPIGLLLHWPPFGIFAALVLGAPVLVNLVDLFGARAGWPPLAWTASQIIARHSANNTKETRTDG